MPVSKTARMLLCILGLSGSLAVANAQTPPATTAFDGTYRPVSWTQATATYTDRNGRTLPCPNRRPGPLHIANGDARYTTATGYKLRGTVGPQGQLAMGLVAPSNVTNAGAQALNINATGQIDSTGMARLHQSGASCSYDFTWQKVGR
jgi:hypothetical protein